MRFDQPVAPGGYAWWYVDAISDDGAHALTLIAFVGSVFSPYYAWARARGTAPAENFCAMNVALYGRRKAWAMTERGSNQLVRQAETLNIGPSALTWQNNRLTAGIDEFTVPVPTRLRGKFSLQAGALNPEIFTLDANNRHRWRPIAPAARIEVDFTNPKLSWSGQAYFDMNEGDAPLESDFSSWHWSRTAGAPGAAILYDVTRRDGTSATLALTIAPSGEAKPFTPPPTQTLPTTLWSIRRATRADAGFTPRIIKTLEDAPFYARSHIETKINGVPSEAIHESLDLERFKTRWVKYLLPFRMPRIAPRNTPT